MTKRRGNGEGSIYRRRDGRWVSAVTLRGGHRKYAYGKTRQEAVAKSRQMQRSIEDGLPIPSRRQTTEAFSAIWLESLKGTVKHSTARHYESLLRVHILPVIGRRQIASIEPVHISNLETRMMGSGSAAATVKHVHKVLRLVFKRAVQWGAIARNPVENIDPPRVTKREPVILVPDQASALLKTVETDALNALWHVAVTTGARISEILALRWEDVDLVEREIRIRSTLTRLNGRWLLETPKTVSSVRTIPITHNCARVILGHRTRQVETAMRAGPAWNNDFDLVFTTETGVPLHRGAVTKNFKQIANELGLPSGMTFHDLRHTAASLLIANGVPIPMVSEVLGHSSPAITYALYAHVIPQSRRQLADRMAAILGA